MRPGSHRRLVSIAAALGLCATGTLHAQQLELRFLDVGQGDAALIRSDGCTALIDAGGGVQTARRLQEMGIDRVTYLIASHNHRDHIGGVGEVLRAATVGLYLENGVPERSQTQRFTRAMLALHGVPQHVASLDTLACGAARLVVGASPLTGLSREQNDLSVIVRLELGEFSALFTGDSGLEQIRAMSESHWARPATVLKAAHHGARDGVTPLWLAGIRPSVVVISVGAGNGYGHPDLFALRYYLTGHREVYRTDRDGEVLVRADTSGVLSVETSRGD